MNIGPAHIEFFPDGLTGIAKAKCEIFEGLNPEAGLAVVNGDDPELMPVFNACWQGQRHEFRLSDATDIQWLGDDGMRFTYQGVDVYVPLPGDHMVSNALGVLAMAEAAIQRLCGSHRVSLAELASGFASLNRVDGRWQKTPIPCYQNAWVINDAYNANPASLKASLSAFLSTLKPDSGEHCILVLGGMKELGDSSLQYHRDTLDWLASHPQAHLLSLLVLVGSEWPDALPAFIIPAAHVLDAGHVAKLIFGRVDSLENTTVLLKGSRAYKLESILAQLGRPESQTESLAEMSS
jgi:UDP-N-acetylmuramoyl-tripeptide--D-alanyl-D-alanine ligase